MTLLKWPRRLVIACRGETTVDVALREADRLGLSQAQLPDRHSRVPLTSFGLDSARDAGKQLYAAGYRPSTVFVSPDLAARQTAAIMLRFIGFEPPTDLPQPGTEVFLGSRVKPWDEDNAARLLIASIDVLHDERLRDRDLGEHAALTTGAALRDFAARLPIDPGPLYRRSPGGESHADVGQRTRDFLGDLGRDLAGKTLLIVTHRAVLFAIRRILEPKAETDLERALDSLEQGVPPWEVYDSRGPAARQFLLHGFNRMADMAQTGARTALSRIRRRAEGSQDDPDPPYPTIPAVAPHEVTGRVLMTYLSAGNGHRISAQAIETELKGRFPTLEIRPPEDLANFSRPGKWGAQLFYKVIDWHIYHRLYDLADRVSSSPDHMNFLRQQVMLMASRRFIKLIKDFQPDIVVHTHPLGTELLSGAKAEGRVPAHILNYQVVTDCYGHSYYVLPNVDATFVPNQEVAEQLAAKGMSPERLYMTGIPIHPAFADRPDPKSARDRLELSASARILLVQGNLIDDVMQYNVLLEHLSGAFPLGPAGLDVEVVVVCGKNGELFRELKDLGRAYTNKIRLRPFGMVPSDAMRDIMAASDLSLTKPGGLTTAESIAMELPMVLLEVMGGGQEGYNAAYFEKEGAAIAVYDYEDALVQLAVVLDRPETLAKMRRAAGRIARPQAASSISNVVASALADPERAKQQWPLEADRGRRRTRLQLPKMS